MAYVNGHERVAALLLEQLWVEGFVRRWKPQPINLLELGGPDITPDFLVELHDRRLFLVEVKAKRFVTPEVQEKFDLEKSFLEPFDIGFLVWTNSDVLSSATNHTVTELDRVRRCPCPINVLAEIKTSVEHVSTVGELLKTYSWEQVLSAISQQIFQIEITEEIHEQTPIDRTPSITRYDYLFATGTGVSCWWDTLQIDPT